MRLFFVGKPRSEKELSLRGAKRRGNLLVLRLFSYILPRDCHGPTALAMTDYFVQQYAEPSPDVIARSEATRRSPGTSFVFAHSARRLPRAYGPRNDMWEVPADSPECGGRFAASAERHKGRSLQFLKIVFGKSRDPPWVLLPRCMQVCTGIFHKTPQLYLCIHPKLSCKTPIFLKKGNNCAILFGRILESFPNFHHS